MNNLLKEKVALVTGSLHRIGQIQRFATLSAFGRLGQPRDWRGGRFSGGALGIAEVTVKLHVGHLFMKLKASDRTQATTIALQRGILHLG